MPQGSPSAPPPPTNPYCGTTTTLADDARFCSARRLLTFGQLVRVFAQRRSHVRDGAIPGKLAVKGALGLGGDARAALDEAAAVALAPERRRRAHLLVGGRVGAARLVGIPRVLALHQLVAKELEVDDALIVEAPRRKLVIPRSCGGVAVRRCPLSLSDRDARADVYIGQVVVGGRVLVVERHEGGVARRHSLAAAGIARNRNVYLLRLVRRPHVVEHDALNVVAVEEPVAKHLRHPASAEAGLRVLLQQLFHHLLQFVVHAVVDFLVDMRVILPVVIFVMRHAAHGATQGGRRAIRGHVRVRERVIAARGDVLQRLRCLQVQPLGEGERLLRVERR
mmetsp:Transcript_23832/g.74987  ORF Transcript_23832/g.74987 Transcript_23832/m.74987 type:complete len:337 (+) Transcript_23832:1624-2634(+)